jgi:hypothetical protein
MKRKILNWIPFNEFDFEIAAKAYSSARWRWTGIGIPTASDIARCAHYLKRQTVRDTVEFSTGGLHYKPGFLALDRKLIYGRNR